MGRETARVNSTVPLIAKRPAHVPEWAWEGFKRHLAEVSHPDWAPYDNAEITVEQRVAFFTRVVASPNSRSLWKALEAHRHELDQHFDLPDPIGHVGTVLEAAHITCLSIHQQQRLTTDERRPFATAVAGSAEKLARSLQEVRALSRADNPAYPGEFPMFDHEEVVTLLDEIRAGALRWLEARPAVDRPGRGNSERRFFISQMTRYFEEVYAAPLERIADLLADCIDFQAEGFLWSSAPLRNEVKSVTGLASAS